ncbi:MAG: phage terminase large subunit [Anaerotignum sp.]
MAYVTEANECTADFIQEVFDRTLTSPERAVFHDLNPKGDGHWYYKTVLDFHAKKQKKNPDYGFNYGHFTIADNLSVSDDNLRKTLSTYDRKSIWYARDIWACAALPKVLSMICSRKECLQYGRSPCGYGLAVHKNDCH